MTSFGIIVVPLLMYVLNATDNTHIPFEKYILPSNGLEVILAEDHSLPIVGLNIWYHVGAVNEPAGRSGFAHLFEHLMFQGSQHVDDDAHFKYLEANGATTTNATTGFYRTNYFQTVPVSALQLALWLESDRMGFLLEALTQEKLDNQREVVMNERRQGLENSPYGPSEEALMHTMFDPNHPYYNSVIGSMNDIAAATLDDVKEFYKRYYAPANATLVLVGDFDVAATKQWINTYFATLPRRDPPGPASLITRPIQQERRTTVAEHVTLPAITMSWLSPLAYKAGDAEADVLANILGEGTSSRLYRHLVYDLEIAQSVYVGQNSGPLVSTFYIKVIAKPGIGIAKLETEIDHVIMQLQKHKPPSERELTRARNIFKTHAILSLQEFGGFGGRADMLNHYNQYTGDPDYLSKDLKRYDRVTSTGIQQLAQTLLQPTQRTIVITVPKT